MAQAVATLIGIFTSRGESRVACEEAAISKNDSIPDESNEEGTRNEMKDTDREDDHLQKDGTCKNDKSKDKEKNKERDVWNKAASARGWKPEDSSKEEEKDPRRDVWRLAASARGWAPEDGDEEASWAAPAGSEGGSSTSQARSTISMLLDIFSSASEPTPEDEQLPPSPELDQLRQAVMRAEAAGASSELLEHVRAKLEELERELARDVKVHIVNGMSGELAAVVRARPCDTAFRLKEALLSEGVVNSEEDGLCSINFLRYNQIMDESMTLAEAGLRDGDQVQLVRSPLRVLTASLDGTVRLWHLNSKATDDINPFTSFREDEALDSHGPVLSASLAPDGRSLLTVAAGGEGQIWCAETGRAVAELEGAAATGQFCSAGHRVVGSSSDEAARIWCASTGKCLHTLRGHTGEVRAARFSPDGSMVLTGAGDGTAALWAAKTGERLASLEGHVDVVKSVDLSACGQMAATASADGTARLWAVPSGKCLQVFRGHTKAISSVKFSPDGHRIMTSSAYDGTARLWEVASGACHLIIPGDGKVVNDAVFSPDGQKVLLASASESLRIFDAEDGECVLTLSGHEDWVRSAAFSPDGTIIGSASYDGTVRLWSVAGKCLKVLEGHDGAVISVAFMEG
ncbi:unnamed protein product [Effrenium voratum]|uniref:Uncharacterized protein n=1 Tax=Effrenium voratum TaxID=2562239 RepID=A0AA36JH62_9DINO|nr:unnamed protein product [Effrenium voratum]|eukprot:CAMPEP_0181397390 /NCGR_PEP_ID=MMETSP1110-20121109/452_1 /TAXON_ID=174948 /ORGANISM="Symbiodinium sp., Strain CCMP421" /LENGTH=630 /DNA_ID=CAMNT_0023519211 /DNA_START=6 /DNA_END=1898 /DNA_ORIENTATION=+